VDIQEIRLQMKGKALEKAEEARDRAEEEQMQAEASVATVKNRFFQNLAIARANKFINL